MRFRMGAGCGPRGFEFPAGMFAMGLGPRGWRGFGPGDWGDWGGGRGRHGRGRRMFDTGELRLVLLKLIADQPRHGYDLIRAIEEMTDGAYAPSPGVVYPTLTMLQDMGLIEEQATEGARKAFAATKEGQAHLAERHHALSFPEQVGQDTRVMHRHRLLAVGEDAGGLDDHVDTEVAPGKGRRSLFDL